MAWTSGRRRLVIWAGVVLLILAVALVPVWLGWDRESTEPAQPASGEPTATPSPTPDAATTSATPEPSATATPSASPEPTDPPEPVEPSPEPIPSPDPNTAELLRGSASAEDPTGDVLDDAGQPVIDALPAADIVAVEVVGDGEDLVVTWRLAGNVPEAADSLLWSLDLWSGAELAATVSVQMIGPRLVAGALDWSTGEQVTPTDEPRVEGASVALTVPLGAFPALEAPITWEALGQQDGGWEDRVPDGGAAPFGD